MYGVKETKVKDLDDVPVVIADHKVRVVSWHLLLLLTSALEPHLLR